MSLNWDGAACAGRGTLFFGPDDEPGSTRNWRESRAKAICARCPIQAACLEYALAENLTDGVWGGVTEAGRARLGSGQNRRLTVAEAGERTCGGCGLTKPLTEFHRDRDRLAYRCKPCRRFTEAERWRRQKVAA